MIKRIKQKSVIAGFLLLLCLLAAGCEMAAGGEEEVKEEVKEELPQTVTYSGVVDGETYTLKITGQTYELTKGGKKSTGTVISDNEGTFTLKPATADKTFTATVDGGSISAMTGTITFTDNSEQPAPPTLTPPAATENNNEDGNSQGNVNEPPPQPPADIWLTDKMITYTVTDGIVGDISQEIEYEYTEYSLDGYICTMTSHGETITDTYTYTSSSQSTITYNRTGINQTSIQQHSESTVTIDYINPILPDSTTETILDSTITSTSILDSETGLTRESNSNSTQTINGQTTSTTATTSYTIELLNTESNGVKTYKYYDTATGGTGTYYIYKIKNAQTLEMSIYTEGNVFNYKAIYGSPDNEAICSKYANWTAISYEFANPQNSYRIVFEVLSDTDTELVFRTKSYYTASQTLMSQTDMVYKKWSVN